ncbi:hypothetical protein EDC56_1286 [Sinobacterium caligoides]|uniref:Uncharacterized protein n=1 Tax=Sinobacterium caligoides TaxID=933926 RepID=A0A3N2E2C9_9GAMM|nr:hypothetical protein [Sinobacterium caligoides]ROS05735.1 hypothetical protein EDC56_1286 [Sinobacterium caligoides]
MFQMTKRILEKTEASILGLSTDHKAWSFFTRFVLFPFSYLRIGVEEFFKPLGVYSFVLIIIFSFFTLMASSSFNDHREYSVYILSLSVFLPMIPAIFSVPSTYAYYGVTDKHVKITTDHIEKERLDTIEKIELLEENIDKIYSRVTARVSFYKWLVGAIWAVYIFGLNIQIKILPKDDLTFIGSFLSQGFLIFSIVFFSTLSAIILVVGYKRASDLIIKSIEFGCVQKKHDLLELGLEK